MLTPTFAPLAALALALAAAGGPSFDCGKARTSDEKLVCSEPTLATLDHELAAKYDAEAKRANAAAAAELRKTQRAWLAERASCARGRGSSGADRKAAVRCLETSYAWRIGDFDRPHKRPNLPPGIVERRLVRRDPRARDAVDFSYPALTAGRQGAAAFDAFFAKQARDRAGKPHGEVVAGASAALEDDPLAQSSLAASFEVPLATPRLVTVVTEGYDYGGGAHGLPFTIATTFDLELERPLTLDDVFANGRGIADALFPVVMDRLGSDAREWEGAEKNARKVLENVSSWTFLADGAAVTFPPYAVAPYAAGSPRVRFTWAELKPYLKAGSPLPPR
jgi:uncharacterized protein YecT (DUF1311 family)